MILCSEGYRQFFNTLLVDSVSFVDLYNLVPGAIEHVADELHLGKFELKVDKAPTGVELTVENAYGILYEDPNGFELAAAKRFEIAFALRQEGFPYVTLDLEGFRSGSMDEPFLMASSKSS